MKNTLALLVAAALLQITPKARANDPSWIETGLTTAGYLAAGAAIPYGVKKICDYLLQGHKRVEKVPDEYNTIIKDQIQSLRSPSDTVALYYPAKQGTALVPAIQVLDLEGGRFPQELYIFLNPNGGDNWLSPTTVDKKLANAIMEEVENTITRLGGANFQVFASTVDANTVSLRIGDARDNMSYVRGNIILLRAMATVAKAQALPYYESHDEIQRQHVERLRQERERLEHQRNANGMH